MMPPLISEGKHRPMRVLIATLLLLCVTACGFVGFPGVYKINIEQGNIITQDIIDQLQPGMSRRQVRFILGTPLVEDTFDQDRWDYPYEIKLGDEIIRKAMVTVYFDGDRLVDVKGDYLPAWAAGAGDNATGTAEAPTEDAS
jgi:outer membrane protein assembly factor BamE